MPRVKLSSRPSETREFPTPGPYQFFVSKTKITKGRVVSYRSSFQLPMTTDVVMVVYSEHGPNAKAGGGVTAHRYAMVSSITPELQTKVFDVLENNYLCRLPGDSDNFASVDPAVDFVRFGIFRDLDEIIMKNVSCTLVNLLATSMAGAGFWLTTRINYPNDGTTFENTFVVPDDWAIKRIYIVNSPRY